MINQILNFVETIEDRSEQTGALLNLLRLLKNYDQSSKEYRSTISALLFSINENENLNLQTEYYLEFLRSYQHFYEESDTLKLLSRVLSLSERLQDTYQRNKALLGLSCAYADLLRFEQALQTSQIISSYQLRLEALVHLAKSYARANQFNQAIELTKSISLPMYHVDAIKLIALEYANIGNFEQALAVVKCENLSENQYKNILKRAIEVSLERRNEELVIEIIDSVEDRSVRNSLTQVIATHYSNIGEFDRAVEIAESITKKEEREHSLVKVAERCVDSKKYEQALDIAKSLRKKDYQALVLEYLINSASFDSTLEGHDELLLKCYKVFQNIRTLDTRFSVGISFANSYTRLGDKNKSLEVLETIYQDIEKRQIPLEARNFMLSRVGVCFARVRELDRAIAIADNLDSLYEKSIVLGVASVHIKIDDEAQSLNLMNESIELLNKLDNSHQIEAVLRQIIEECGYVEDCNQAVELAQTILSKSINFNYIIGTAACLNLVPHLLRSRAIDEVSVLLRNIFDHVATQPDSLKAALVSNLVCACESVWNLGNFGELSLAE